MSDTEQRVLMAFYPSEQEAERGLETLLEQDVPMRRISMIGKASASGDDLLGVYYLDIGERMGWGKVGGSGACSPARRACSCARNRPYAGRRPDCRGIGGCRGGRQGDGGGWSGIAAARVAI